MVRGVAETIESQKIDASFVLDLYTNSIREGKMSKEIKDRLEYLRGEIVAERISYGEIAELQSLADYIDKGDTLLLEWAGVPENEKT